MGNPSPTVARIVAVLNFFLEHPQQAFTLTQIVKSLDLSRATAHSILLGFVDSGYLYRRADKSYVLGPVLPSLATNAHRHFSPLAVASQEMRTLADELKVVASALFREGDELVVRERAASASHLGLPQLKAGRRFPILPWGSVFLMSLPDATLEDQLARVTPPLSKAARGEIAIEIDFGRRHGFIAMLLGDDENGERDIQSRGHPVADIDAHEIYQLRYLVAPVMGENREAALAISLFGFGRQMVGADILLAGQRLRGTCDRISDFIRGKQSSNWEIAVTSRA